MRTYITSFFLVLLSILLAACSPGEAVSLRTENLWARPASVGQNSAIYLTIHNPSGVTESLDGVEVSIARAAELHRSMEDSQGVMSMHAQHVLEIPAKGELVFEPGGLHIMLIDLKQELKPGDTFDVVFHFKHAGTVSIPVEVKAP